MSDGTPELRFLDPDVAGDRGASSDHEGEPVRNVNELEWVKGRIYANVWQTNVVIIIDPAMARLRVSST